MKLSPEFGRFLLVGGAVFCIDMLVCLMFWQALGWSVVAARIMAFVIAAVAQWAGHRWFSFKGRPQQRPGLQACQSLLLASSAALVNLSVFTLSVVLLPEGMISWVLAMAGGVLAGTLINWVGANNWVFAWPDTRQG